MKKKKKKGKRIEIGTGNVSSAHGRVIQCDFLFRRTVRATVRGVRNR